MALSIPGGDAVHKISIIPRGIAALGYTMQLPTEDRFLMTMSELKNRIAILLGGRAAEEVIYGEVSTGAQDDLRKATDIAKSMVKAYGMSEKLGQVSLERDRQSIFLQTGAPQTPGDYSEQTSREIDYEVRLLIDEQYERARDLIKSQEATLRHAAQVLLEKETISGEELKALATAQ
jgi:cell division protease FtsH